MYIDQLCVPFVSERTGSKPIINLTRLAHIHARLIRSATVFVIVVSLINSLANIEHTLCKRDLSTSKIRNQHHTERFNSWVETPPLPQLVFVLPVWRLSLARESNH